MNKRGASAGIIWAVILIIIILAGLIKFDVGGIRSVLNPATMKANLAMGGTSFGSINLFGKGKSSSLSFLDYVIGKIPTYLIDNLGGGNEAETSAAIIIIGVWIIFFFAFYDMVYLFGTFSPPVNYAFAVVMAVITANLKFMSALTVYMLTITALFGALSIIIALIGIVVMFFLWHTGSNALRDKVMERRNQDFRLRAGVGAAKAAAGIEDLAKVSKVFEKSGR